MQDQNIEYIRCPVASRFKELDSLIKFKGTHLMREKMTYLKELLLTTALKSFDVATMRDYQEIFANKLKEFSWFNGFKEIEEEDFNAIYEEWSQLVITFIDDFTELDVFDFNSNLYDLELNLASFTEHDINIEKILNRKKEK